MCFADIETDSLIVKLKQFTSIQQAAHELMEQEHDEQAISTYVALCKLILEIEMELNERRSGFAAFDTL